MSASTHATHTVFLGIGLKLTAVLAFSVMNAFIKLVADFPTGEIVFARSIFAFIPIFIMAAITADGVRKMVVTKRPWLHVRRSLLGTAAMFGYFTSIALVPLVDATAIGFLMPIFAVVLAAVILKERVGVFRWGAVAVGLVGVLLIIEPHGGIRGLVSGGLSYGVIFGLIGAFLAAFVVVFIRQMSETETSESIVFYFALFCSIASGLTMLYDFKMPNAEEAFYLVVIGVLGGVAQQAMTFSYRYAEPSLLAPFDYVAIVWATIIGFLFFGETPLPIVILGSSIVVAAGLVIAWRERARGQMKPKPQSM